MATFMEYLLCVKVGGAISHSEGLCTHTVLVKTFSVFVQGTPKCKHVGTFKTTLLCPYPTSEDYNSFSMLLTTYAKEYMGYEHARTSRRLKSRTTSKRLRRIILNTNLCTSC